METKEYFTQDKSTWGDGPWMNEPDKVQYPDPETGLPCLIVRNHSGALCGYVGVTEGHPYFKKEGFDFDLRVHGGITFSNMCRPGDNEADGICHIPGEGEPDHVWWLGFDCSHAWDVNPGLNDRYGLLPEISTLLDALGRDAVYRDIGYVKDQIANLAKQLAEIA